MVSLCLKELPVCDSFHAFWLCAIMGYCLAFRHANRFCELFFNLILLSSSKHKHERKQLSSLFLYVLVLTIYDLIQMIFRGDTKEKILFWINKYVINAFYSRLSIIQMHKHQNSLCLFFCFLVGMIFYLRWFHNFADSTIYISRLQSASRCLRVGSTVFFAQKGLGFFWFDYGPSW